MQIGGLSNWQWFIGIYRYLLQVCIQCTVAHCTDRHYDKENERTQFFWAAQKQPLSTVSRKRHFILTCNFTKCRLILKFFFTIRLSSKQLTHNKVIMNLCVCVCLSLHHFVKCVANFWLKVNKKLDFCKHCGIRLDWSMKFQCILFLLCALIKMFFLFSLIHTPKSHAFPHTV